jgi:hypothetical protein
MKVNITLFTVFLSKSYSYVWFGIVMSGFCRKMFWISNAKFRLGSEAAIIHITVCATIFTDSALAVFSSTF